jgi:signal transduction histidine kinase
VNGQHHHKADILVVDDTPTNLDLLFSVLGKAGYHIRPAPSGELALRAAFAKPPDLILLDVNMRGMDGYEVCEQLKQDERTKNVPVIFLSAMDEVIDKVRAFNVGAVDYISKPFDVEEVLARIETQLTLYHQRLEIEALREQERRHFEEMARLKDQYVQMVSHDLKTPLSVIIGNASLMMKRGTLTNDADIDSLEGIIESAEMMRRLIRDLLDLAKIESGVGGQTEHVSVNELLEACVVAFVNNAQEKDIALNLNLLDEDMHVDADHDRLVQVLSNLISNAIKYTPEGGQVDVYGHYRTDKNALHIEVKDTGLGIPEHDLPHIFDRFYRVERSQHQQQSGTGLGLSITKAIIEQHGGTIHAESELGKGTRFVITLPTSQHVVSTK